MKLEAYRTGHTWSASGESIAQLPGEPRPHTKLEPCPFCGSTDITCQNTHTPYYWAECQNCDAQGPTESGGYNGKPFTTKREALRVHAAAFVAAVRGWNGAPRR